MIDMMNIDEEAILQRAENSEIFCVRIVNVATLQPQNRTIQNRKCHILQMI